MEDTETSNLPTNCLNTIVTFFTSAKMKQAVSACLACLDPMLPNVIHRLTSPNKLASEFRRGF